MQVPERDPMGRDGFARRLRARARGATPNQQRPERTQPTCPPHRPIVAPRERWTEGWPSGRAARYCTGAAVRGDPPIAFDLSKFSPEAAFRPEETDAGDAR